LKKLAPATFADLRLNYEDITVLGTPRRLVVLVSGLNAAQPDLEETVKGPPAERAFGADGKPTKAAQGFARSRGVAVKDLKVKKIDGGEYVVAAVHEKGRTVFEILPEKLTELASALRFTKSMRWNASGVSFSRPVRWLTAIFGEHPVQFEYAGLVSGNTTRGLRFIEPEEAPLGSVSDYLPFLKKQGIITDPEARKAEITKQVKKLLASVEAAPEIDAGLLDEVANLVEAPTALLGNFNEAHLALPPEVLISVMKKYQRYFPVKNTDGKLMPYFITVRNGGDQHLDKVAKGNEEVISARFEDAAFFIRDDSKGRLEDFLPRLDTLIFHPKLGSMLDKTKRIQQLVDGIAAQIKLDKKEKETALAAARLCKADLATKMVVEMTSLQGTMGRHYAMKDGVDAAAAEAIETHYQPRSAGDSAPESMVGLVVGIADRLDSLVGLFAVGMAPTGAKDPFGLRRAAIGLVGNLIDKNISIDLRESVRKAARSLPVKMAADDEAACLAFITGRLENVLLEAGNRYDVVKAVLAEQGHDPSAAAANVKQLGKWVQRDDWHEILPAFARCVRITRDLTQKGFRR
jgi:glycyl-tRNA synthetase